MRLLHTADLHLGRAFAGLSLENDQAAVLDQIAAAVRDLRPDLLVIAGDIFDRAVPPAPAVRLFNDFLARVAAETDAAVALVAGNHDSPDRIEAMAVASDRRRFLLRGAPGAEGRPLVLADRHGAVAVVALPFAQEYAARAAFGDETLTSPAEVLAAQIARAHAGLPPGGRWIAVAHAFVAGGTGSGAERPLARVGGVETVPAALFDGAAYVALGHLHRPQQAGAAHVRYCGAPLAFGFDEAGEARSMNLVEIDAAGAATVEAIPFRPRRGLRVLRGAHAELTRLPPSEDFVRAVLTDAAPVPDAMRRLRAVFPNACEMVYARDAEAPVPAAGAPASAPQAANPVAVVAGFLRLVRDAGPSKAEKAVLADALAALDRRKETA
jgi:exonuclease SbcD